MDQNRCLRFLSQAETCRVVLLMVLVVTLILGLQYFERAPLFTVSSQNDTVSESKESSIDTTKSTKNDTFLASQEHKFLNTSPTTEASQSIDNQTTSSLHHLQPEASKSIDNQTTSSLHHLQQKSPQIQKKHEEKKNIKKPPPLVTLTQINNMLLKWQNNPNNTLAPLWESKVDKELKTARNKIKNSALVIKDDTLYAPLYHNISIFKRSYELMEKTLKVYIYSEGEKPIFHKPEAKKLVAVMATSVATLSSRPPVTLPLSSSRSSFFSNCFTVSSPRKTRSLVAIRPRIREESTRKPLTCNALFGLGVPELAVIAGVAALLFGPKKLPEIGKSIGKTVKSFQQAAKEFESELKTEPDDSVSDSSPVTMSNKEEEKQTEVSSSSKE